MILLDTHVWIWWVHGEPELPQECHDVLQEHEDDGLGVSAISCWEVAKLVQSGRLSLPVSVSEWMNLALAYPGIRLLDLSPRIAVESTQLPGDFHRDPADQILVATARIHNVSTGHRGQADPAIPARKADPRTIIESQANRAAS